jgi:arabinofuranan 3-O-arabinosyltransferase
MSTVSYTGAVDITASSSGSDATAVLNRSPAHSPYAAVDGDPDTAWMSGSISGAVGQWLQVALPSPISVTTGSLAFPSKMSAYPTRLRITTDSGALDEDVSPDSGLQQITLPAGPTQTVRLTVLDMSKEGFGLSVGISTLTLPHVSISRTLDVPGPLSPDVIAFEAGQGQRPSCLPLGTSAAACDPSWAAQGEEDGTLDRSFNLGDRAAYQVDAGFRLLPSSITDGLLDSGNPLRAIASSTYSADPRQRPGAAVDGNLQSGWVAAANDKSPTITVSFAQPSQITGVVINAIPGAPVTDPTRVQITTGGISFSANVPADGTITLPQPVVSNSITITVLASTLRVSTDSLTGIARLLPVGIGEIRPLGSNIPLAAAPRVVSVACGFGPSLVINGKPTLLQFVSVSAADVLAGNVVHASICGSNTLPVGAGPVHVQLVALDWVSPVSLRLTRSGGYLADAPSGGLTSVVRTWSSTSRSVQVRTTDQPGVLIVRENANAGWVATLNGHRLAEVSPDGWEQGYVVPADSSGLVHLRFTPQRSVTVALTLGLLAILALVGLLAIPGQRAIAPSPSAEWGGARRDLTCIIGSTLLAGVVGLIGAIAIALLRARTRLRPPAWSPPLALMLAGLLEAVEPVGSAHPQANGAAAQVLTLLAVLLAVLRSSPRPTGAGESPEQGPLDQVPTDGRDDGGRASREQVEDREVAGEALPSHPPLDGNEER